MLSDIGLKQFYQLLKKSWCGSRVQICRKRVFFKKIGLGTRASGHPVLPYYVDPLYEKYGTPYGTAVVKWSWENNIWYQFERPLATHIARTGYKYSTNM
jgi:hypothetical protein